ncbi:hypothetical protein CSKR_105574 [Clonorchis sinensis]|uniref:Uncharacterized protein n=1 Tax=Clonorchis sinensis TaxID=79923 RepID=A0A419PNM5_CLOSI|nr:hypothetical protein CSKR_105574 [Clonorchis sinensis]
MHISFGIRTPQSTIAFWPTLLKILRQPMTGFALLGAHQVGAVPEIPSTLCST